jgi:hypothetical protein
MEETTKNIIAPMIQMMADISKRQAGIYELLSIKLDLTDEEKSSLLELAQENQKNIEKITQSLEAWK